LWSTWKLKLDKSKSAIDLKLLSGCSLECQVGFNLQSA
jgi:hypothetical protein